MKNQNIKNKYLFSVFFALILSLTSNAQNKTIEVNGIITDGTDFPLPYVAIGIVNKNIGTSSTEDGEFYLKVSNNELQDSLYVSYLGFHTYKVKIADYIALKDKKIVLKEDVVVLNDVELLPPKTYIVNALKKLKENTLYKTKHVKEILYRRAVTEGGKAKFFVENFIRVRDRGPASFPGLIEVKEVRKSADYRIWKRKQWRHSLLTMYDVNPLRPQESMHRVNLKKFKWTKKGDSSYEGEDVLILEGQNPKKNWDKITMYVGIDTYKVYRIERNSVLLLFKKHKSGKMHLSYYKNEWNLTREHIPKHLHNTPAEKTNYRLEAFVYNIETDKNKLKVRDFGGDKDMGNIELPYHSKFWENLNLPPDTKFYKKIKKELEGLYGVSLELQYKVSNK